MTEREVRGRERRAQVPLQTGRLLEEEPRGEYLVWKVYSVGSVSLITGIFLWAVALYALGEVDSLGVIVAGGLATLLVWGLLLAIGPMLRRQRARLYERAFAPPYKSVSDFFLGRTCLVPREEVREAEYYHADGVPHFRVETRDGRRFLYTPGKTGRAFFDALGEYFSVGETPRGESDGEPGDGR